MSSMKQKTFSVMGVSATEYMHFVLNVRRENALCKKAIEFAPSVRFILVTG